MEKKFIISPKDYEKVFVTAHYWAVLNYITYVMYAGRFSTELMEERGDTLCYDGKIYIRRIYNKKSYYATYALYIPRAKE